MRNRVIGIIITCEALLILLVPLITFNWEQGVKSEAENRMLKEFPTIMDSDGLISKTLLQDLNCWFQDNIGCRDNLINLSSIISINLFHQSTSEDVEIGKDGWLFYNKESNMDIARGTYSGMEEEQLDLFCNKLIEVQKRLEKQGRDFVLVLPPSKVSIYPEYIQSGDYKIQRTPTDALADYIENHSSIKVVRLKDALLEEKKKTNDLLYFKTDTHWNYKGRYVAYKSIIDNLNKWGIINSNPLKADFYQGDPYSGDLANMMGVVNLSGKRLIENDVQNIELSESKISWVNSGEYYEKYTSLFDLKNGSMWGNNSLVDGKKMVFYGDSMGSGIVGYLAEHFSLTTFVWTYEIEQNRINYLDPDVVVLDISERGINVVIKDIFDEYLKTDYEFDENNNSLDIYYYDNSANSEIYCAFWSEMEGQDDLIWYQAEKYDVNNCWHISVDLKNHESDGMFNLHFYNGLNGNGECVYTTKYYH